MPRNPGLLCAWGAIGAPLGREYSLTVRAANPSYQAIVAHAAAMQRRARTELHAEGAASSAVTTEIHLDLRYLGQSYEIEVPLTRDFIGEFHAAHRRAFGHSTPGAVVEVVNIRLRATPAQSPFRSHNRAAARSAGPISHAQVLAGERARNVPIYSRDALGAGARIRGPAIIVELSSTAYVAPQFTMRTDDYGNLHLEAG